MFLSYVCGGAGSGKTSLLRAFVGRKFSDAYNPTKRMNSVVNSVDIEGSEKYLVVSGFYCEMAEGDRWLIVKWTAARIRSQL